MKARAAQFLAVVDWAKLLWLVLGFYALYGGIAMESGQPILPALRHATGSALVFVGGFLIRREKKDLGEDDLTDLPDRSRLHVGTAADPTRSTDASE